MVRTHLSKQKINLDQKGGIQPDTAAWPFFKVSDPMVTQGSSSMEDSDRMKRTSRCPAPKRELSASKKSKMAEPKNRTTKQIHSLKEDNKAEIQGVQNFRTALLEQKKGIELEKNQALKILIPVLKAIRRYHQHEIQGLDHIPRNGRVLVVVNHSLATYDIFLLLHAIFEDVGRLPRPLADRLFFKIPLLGDLIRFYGAVQGAPNSAKRLLENDELVTVAPGGMREALRPSNQKYQVMWHQRKGFVKLAIETNTPIVLAACPRADDLYDIYPSHLTAWFYESYKIPFFFASGWKKTIVPHPVKLVHHISEPMQPPPMPRGPKALEQVIEEFHESLTVKMQELMNR